MDDVYDDGQMLVEENYQGIDEPIATYMVVVDSHPDQKVTFMLSRESCGFGLEALAPCMQTSQACI